MLLINRATAYENFNNVTMDNFKSVYIATRKLIENGHHRIMMLLGPSNSTSIRKETLNFK